MNDVKSNLCFTNGEINYLINKLCFDQSYTENVDDTIDIIKTLMTGAEDALTEYLEIYKQRKEEIRIWEKKKSICND